MVSATSFVIIEESSSSTPSESASVIAVKLVFPYVTLLPPVTAFFKSSNVIAVPSASAIVLPAALYVMVYVFPLTSTVLFAVSAVASVFALSISAVTSVVADPIVYSFPAIVYLSPA